MKDGPDDQLIGRTVLVIASVLVAVWMLWHFGPALAWASVLAIATRPLRERLIRSGTKPCRPPGFAAGPLSVSKVTPPVTWGTSPTAICMHLSATSRGRDGRVLGSTNTSMERGMFILGTNGNDSRNGTSAPDAILGLDGNDTLNGAGGDDGLAGGNGNDSLVGGSGDDTLSGDANDDTLAGGSGADRLEGDSGIDLVDYSSAPQVSPTSGFTGVFVNLMIGQGAVGDAQGDTYSDIENIRGSAFNDGLVGNDSANRIDGGTGDDSIMGNFGADTLIGGQGHDLVSYADSNSEVLIDLAFNVASGGDASGDQIRGFEDLIGSDFADTLFGNDAANFIAGGEGANLVDGNGGNDTLTGGTGNDTLRGLDQDDDIRGGRGADLIDGGNDNDILSGGANADTFRFAVLSISGGHGADTVQDFDANEDRLLFDALSPLSLADLNITQVGANTVITYVGGFEGSVTLNNVNVNDLLANAQTALAFA